MIFVLPHDFYSGNGRLSIGIPGEFKASIQYMGNIIISRENMGPVVVTPEGFWEEIQPLNPAEKENEQTKKINNNATNVC